MPAIARRGTRAARTPALALALAVGLGTVLSGCGGSDAGTSGANGSVSTLSGIKGFDAIPAGKVKPAPGSVTLTDGSTWSYAHPTAGRVTLLYFGYTSCPDVCPLTMADLAAALTRVSPEVRDKVWVQFVSTDPHRDTDQQLTRWLGGFDPTFHGGRAPISQVIASAKALGILIKAPKVSAHDYQVSHGAQVYVLNPAGQPVGLFTELAGPGSYAAALPSLVASYAS